MKNGILFFRWRLKKNQFKDVKNHSGSQELLRNHFLKASPLSNPKTQQPTKPFLPIVLLEAIVIRPVN